MKFLKKCLILVLSVVLLICSILLGVEIWKYTAPMRGMTYFDIYGGVVGEEDPLFISTKNSDVSYQAVVPPEAVTREMLTKDISVKDYNDIAKSERGNKYYVFFSPLTTDDEYVLLVPVYDNTGPWRQFGYYAKRIEPK